MNRKTRFLYLLAFFSTGCVNAKALKPHVIDAYVHAKTVADSCHEEQVLGAGKCDQKALDKLAEENRKIVCVVVPKAAVCNGGEPG